MAEGFPGVGFGGLRGLGLGLRVLGCRGFGFWDLSNQCFGL